MVRRPRRHPACPRPPAVYPQDRRVGVHSRHLQERGDRLRTVPVLGGWSRLRRQVAGCSSVMRGAWQTGAAVRHPTPVRSPTAFGQLRKAMILSFDRWLSCQAGHRRRAVCFSIRQRHAQLGRAPPRCAGCPLPAGPRNPVSGRDMLKPFAFQPAVRSSLRTPRFPLVDEMQAKHARHPGFGGRR